MGWTLNAFIYKYTLRRVPRCSWILKVPITKNTDFFTIVCYNEIITRRFSKLYDKIVENKIIVHVCDYYFAPLRNLQIDFCMRFLCQRISGPRGSRHSWFNPMQLYGCCSCMGGKRRHLVRNIFILFSFRATSTTVVSFYFTLSPSLSLHICVCVYVHYTTMSLCVVAKMLSFSLFAKKHRQQHTLQGAPKYRKTSLRKTCHLHVVFHMIL